MVDFGGSITFTGLSSGIDTASIVTQLIAVESAPKTLLIQQQAVTNLQNADFADISTKLYTLKSAADALRSFSLYAGSPTATSADTTKLTASATSAAAASSYNVVVSNVARAAVSQQATTPSISQFGALYAGNGTYAASTTKLSDLTTSTGAAAGYAVGSSITMNSTRGGQAHSASFTVTDTSTVNDLTAWMQKQLPGSSVSLQVGGAIKVTSAPGLDQANTGISLGGAAGAATETQAAAGNTTLSAAGGMDISSSGVAIHVDLTAGMTMSDVAAAINAKNGAITGDDRQRPAPPDGEADRRRFGHHRLERHRRRLGDRPDLGGRRLRCLRHDRRQRVHELHEPGDHRDLGRDAQPDRGDGPRRGVAHGQSVAGRQRRRSPASCRTSSRPTTT